MSKLKLKPTIEESFSIGKNVGAKEAFEEILDLLETGMYPSALKVYAKSRIKSLLKSAINNPFKQKD